METVTGWPMELLLIREELLLSGILLIQALAQTLWDVSSLRQLLAQNLKNMFNCFDRFRDFYLMPNRIGRTFVKAYYRYSPPMADFIAKHDILRTMVRWGLAPLIAVSWMLLHFGAAPTLLLLGLMFSGMFIIGYRKVRHGILHEN